MKTHVTSTFTERQLYLLTAWTEQVELRAILKLKQFCIQVEKHILTYASESWITAANNRSNIRSKEIRFLMKIDRNTKLDTIKKGTFRKKLGIIPVENIFEEGQLRG